MYKNISFLCGYGLLSSSHIRISGATGCCCHGCCVLGKAIDRARVWSVAVEIAGVVRAEREAVVWGVTGLRSLLWRVPMFSWRRHRAGVRRAGVGVAGNDCRYCRRKRNCRD